jgi:xylan 1,4-beta-xylosidase
VWNYADPGTDGAPREITLALEGAGAGGHARISRVDRDHGSPLAAWEGMGRPESPTIEQQRKLREAGQMASAEVRALDSGRAAAITLTIPAHGLALVEVVPR